MFKIIYFCLLFFLLNYLFYICLNINLKQYKMNLFERLKPEYKDNLETGNTKHPALVGYAVDQLELYEFVRDMPYGLVVDLRFLLDVDSPYELFKEI